MTADEIRERFNTLTQWKRDGERAPHKPLLALYAIGRLLRGEPRLVDYARVDRDLGKLLTEFGPRRQSVHTEYPFWRLQNDHVWELRNAEGVEARRSNTDAKKSELLAHDVQGGFPEEIYQQLASKKRLTGEIVQNLLNANFPETLHPDILDAVGIDLAAGTRLVAPRSADFRERVLRAYAYSCAVCGFDVRLGNIHVALEAAHIKWHQAGGPDEESNGLALCTMHHKLFDRGMFTLTDKGRIIVSENANGTTGFREWVMAYHGHPMRSPQRPSYYPQAASVQWHVKEVFQGPGRHEGDGRYKLDYAEKPSWIWFSTGGSQVHFVVSPRINEVSFIGTSSETTGENFARGFFSRI